MRQKITAEIDVVNTGKSKKKTLVIGNGEIGRSMAEILNDTYEVHIRDVVSSISGQFDVLNICYPYSEQFVDITKNYIKQYQPKLVIVHSTVKPGTTRAIGKLAVHSPVNGRHPDLVPHIRAFSKVVAGMNAYKVYQAYQFLTEAGLSVQIFSSPESSEVAKICCTSIQYALDLVKMKEMVRIAQEFNVPFHEIYTQWNTIYNHGYATIGEYRFNRTNLLPMEGVIGGHCVIPNCELLEDEICEFVKSRNHLYEKNGKSEKSEVKLSMPARERESVRITNSQSKVRK
ncbi:MAG: hypothetical protein AAB407_03825 [Patescibacteria group bacterium]